ncbi:uroporphyrinogen-III synthase [Glutamicibacter mishrai]|uniref:uroporphyrinogen-III synthase n=1 Tax=Glutamicibacter mishrai TaxID=1775880 RepID=UPI0020CCF48D|nr:uroporphyrinogen-III synthase [Glutamicibacter mishrai]UTT38567.1 uroporphyrinogen-III synthase [Glutamicibacter mishrai]
MAYHALILRNPARAEATVRQFEQLGITSWCAQLVTAIWPEDRQELETMAQRLVDGGYSWLAITSVSTVQVLEQVLGSRTLPSSLRIASVGEKTSQAIAAKLGRSVDFQPQVQSAAGMLDLWRPEPGSVICYPHGDLASSTLSDALADKPVTVDEVIAYQSVDAPAAGTPVDAARVPEAVNVLHPGNIGGKLGQMDLIVFSAPSIVRRFAQLAGGRIPQKVRTIAIGAPTAKALKAVGLPVDAIASEPTPQGLARAAKELLQPGGVAAAEETK